MKYRLLQLDIDNSRYAFMPYAFAETHGFDKADYHLAYEGVMPNGDPEIVLEALFSIFNHQRPKDFHGHSMSVSDIVELDGKTYYCDSIGFVEI